MTSIAQCLLRAAAQKLVGLGLPVPEIALSRLPDYARVRKLFRTLEINYVYDVGANRGQFGLLLRRLGYQGSIFSFEPQPGSFDVLKQRTAADPGWKSYPLALGETDGKVQLRINSQYPEMTSLLPVDGAYGSSTEVEIEMVTLDSLHQELTNGIEEPKGFLKVDTEGYDLNVLRGARNSLAAMRALQIEAFVQPIYQGAPHYLEVLVEVESLGFELEHISVVSTTAEDKLLCLNALMVRL